MKPLNCMGGWCRVRETCHYHEPKPGAVSIERLCEKEKTDCYVPIELYWRRNERAHEPSV